MQETEPTVYSPYPRRIEHLTSCRYNYKGRIYSSVILRPWVLVRSGLEPSTSRTADWLSTNWANQAAVIITKLTAITCIKRERTTNLANRRMQTWFFLFTSVFEDRALQTGARKIWFFLSSDFCQYPKYLKDLLSLWCSTSLLRGTNVLLLPKIFWTFCLLIPLISGIPIPGMHFQINITYPVVTDFNTFCKMILTCNIA